MKKSVVFLIGLVFTQLSITAQTNQVKGLVGLILESDVITDYKITREQLLNDVRSINVSTLSGKEQTEMKSEYNKCRLMFNSFILTIGTDLTTKQTHNDNTSYPQRYILKYTQLYDNARSEYL